MASPRLARLAGALTLPWTIMAGALPTEAQSQGTVTICQGTGSPSNPWVFTTIDARDLPEHLARGDFPANSIADCAAPSPAGTPVPQASPAPTATTSPTRSPEAGRTATPTQRPAAAATGIAATAAPSPTVASAGVQTTPAPDVSTLPRSRGEPDRPTLLP